jgi:hypothetical protein
MPKNKRQPELGRVIARRVLEARKPEMIRRVTVSIGAPRRHPKGDWECPYRIEGLGESKVSASGGVDSLQALILAIEGIRVTLERTGDRFVWLDEAFGAGIPSYIPTHYGPRFESRISQVLEREAQRYWTEKFKASKADLTALAAEVKQRKETLAVLVSELKRRQPISANWEESLKNWKPSKKSG